MAGFLEHLPELFVALAYYQCGAYLSFILYSYTTISITWRDYTFIWALCFAILGALAAALILSFCKAVSKRIVWIHLYLFSIGSALLLASGLILLLNNAGWLIPDSSIVIGGFGHGIVYISGLAYIHVRTNSRQHRVARLGLCHLSIAIGIATSASAMSRIFQWPFTYYLYGHYVTWSAVSALVLLLANELMQGLGVYDYKKCLDRQLYEADQKKDRLRSSLRPTDPRNNLAKGNKSKQATLALTAIAGKMLSGFFYSNIFMILTIYGQQDMPPGTGRGFMRTILHYFAMAGIIFGMIVSLKAKIKTLYPVSLLGSAIALTLAAVFWSNPNNDISAIFFWIFYFIAGMGVFLPDVAILEVSSPNFSEINLFLGFVVEKIPIVVSVYFVREEFYNTIYNGEILWTNVGMYIGFALVVAMITLFWYPNTFQLRVLQIQKLILFNESPSFLPNSTPAVTLPPIYPTPAQYPVHHAPPPMMYAPLGPVLMSGPLHQPPMQVPAPVQGYFSSQPIYPGQQPVYMVAQPAGPSQPGIVVTQRMDDKSTEASAPAMPQDNDNWHQRQQPPAYGAI